MNENIILMITNIVIYAFCGGMLIIMPYLTRKSYLFGVKIPPAEAQNQKALEMKRDYIRKSLLGITIIVAVCIMQYILNPELTILTTMYLPFLILPVYLIAYVPNWRRAVELKEESGWRVSNVLLAETKSSHSRGNLSSLPWIWYIISFIIVCGTFMFAIYQYPHLPDKIPTHLDASLQPTSYVDKTWLFVLLLPLCNLGTLLLLFFAGISIEKAKLQIDPVSPQISFAQHRVYRKRMGHAMGLLSLSIVLFMAIVGIPMLSPDSVSILSNPAAFLTLLLFVIPTTILIIVQIRTGQGGCKVKVNIDDINNDKQDAGIEKDMVPGRGDDRYWKLGMFYYNPDDPAFFVEDRFGTNIGINYARIPAKLLLLFAVVSLAVLYVWMTKEILLLIS